MVTDNGKSEQGLSAAAEEGLPLAEREKTYFEQIKDDYKKVKEEIAKEAGIVHGFEDSRSARVPWLERTGFPFHLNGLLDEEIHDSYKVPSDRELESDKFDDPVLAHIIAATRSLLREAYELCRDTLPDRKMTYQRARILNEFYVGATGKSDAFRYYKMESSLAQYFYTWVQLIVFYYRVVHATGGHFSRREPEHQVLTDVIQPTTLQRKTFGAVIKAATDNTDDNNSDAAPLTHLLRRFFLALICHVVGGWLHIPVARPQLLCHAR